MTLVRSGLYVSMSPSRLVLRGATSSGSFVRTCRATLTMPEARKSGEKKYVA